MKNCKISFEQFFNSKTKTLYESKDQDEIIKYHQRLLGNILFVGELNRRGLLQESIILSVFDMLLCVDSVETQMGFINDQTVEGAVVLMTKIGKLIDDKINSIQGKIDSGTALKSGEKVTLDKINRTFARFEELASETGQPQLSTRAKLLIKNMMDYRKAGWP